MVNLLSTVFLEVKAMKVITGVLGADKWKLQINHTMKIHNVSNIGTFTCYTSRSTVSTLFCMQPPILWIVLTLCTRRLTHSRHPASKAAKVSYTVANGNAIRHIRSYLPWMSWHISSFWICRMLHGSLFLSGLLFSFCWHLINQLYFNAIAMAEINILLHVHASRCYRL